jgi:mannose-6-phosphate isomerase-like protein (cupin superfamily)
MKFLPVSEEKVWGKAMHLFANDHAAVSLLEVKAGYHCSRHYHTYRANQFSVVSGRVVIEWTDKDGIQDNSIELGAGESFTVPSLVTHRFRVLESGVVIEVYWLDGPAGSVRLDDITRFDKGGLDNVES